MDFKIRGNNIEVTPALREYVEKKLGKLEKYFNTPPEAEVNVTLSVIKELHSVEVTIPLPGVILRAEVKNGDMYAAIDLVVDKLERQIRKHKTKVNRKFRQEGGLKSLLKEDFAPLANGQTVDEEEEEFEVVRSKKFHLKPMDVEEAILQMNLVGHNFYVFANTATDEINVVYRRNDGKYGLIEPVQ
jgi:putative sigma-54 modulation protein